MYGVVGTDGVVYGPVTVAALFEWIAQGRVVPTTILIDGQGRQKQAASLPELQGAFPIQAQPYAFAPPPQAYSTSTKSKRAALWLAFLLGMFGAHRFYLGHRTTGFAMLLLNVAAFAFVSKIETVILIEIVATVWLVVDMAMIAGGKLTDSSGLPLR